jgi:hypothetical protein
MSLTPDTAFNGESTCTACDKPMFVNDVGVVYRPYKRPDFLFCSHCAVQMTMSIAQDISKLAKKNSDTGLSYYFQYKDMNASAWNLRRHATALKELAEQMDQQAESLAYFHHPDEDK